MPQATDARNSQLDRFVALEHERRQIEERLDQIREEVRRLESEIVSDWLDRGQQNAKLDGLTVFIATDFVCSKRTGIDTSRVCDVLQTIGLGNLVAPAYNAQSLKSWVKSRLEERDESTEADQEPAVPEHLAELIQWETIPRLRSRRS